MSLLTLDDAYAATAGMSFDVVEKSLRASAAQRDTAHFDVFLSHSIQDARAIDGIRRLLVGTGLSVYVDWIDDPELDRSRVTAKTAAKLRDRMQHSNSLIYVTSVAATTSKWMPWELGYFDGHQPRKVAILPLAQAPTNRFRGQEYLGLYPYLEIIDRYVGIRLRGGRSITVPEFVRGGAFIVTS